MIELACSMITRRVFAGLCTLKGSLGVPASAGRKQDVTESFYRVLLQMFPPEDEEECSGRYLLLSPEGKPMYRLTVEKIEEEGL